MCRRFSGVPTLSGYTCGPALKWIHAWRGDLHACLRSDAEPLGFRQRAVPTDAAAFDAHVGEWLEVEAYSDGWCDVSQPLRTPSAPWVQPVIPKLHATSALLAGPLDDGPSRFLFTTKVTESARACSYILGKQVQKTCQVWLLTVPSPLILSKSVHSTSLHPSQRPK